MLLTKGEIRNEVQSLLTVRLTPSFLCMSINEIVLLKMNYLFLCMCTAETYTCVMPPLHTVSVLCCMLFTVLRVLAICCKFYLRIFNCTWAVRCCLLATEPQIESHVTWIFMVNEVALDVSL
jgi:hypothetical protein